MRGDGFSDLIEPHALGALDPGERAGLESHLAGCPDCGHSLGTLREVLASVAAAPPDAALAGEVRQQLLDLAEAPALPIDTDALPWQEVAPGVRLSVLWQEPARNLRACLALGHAGARLPRHRHAGAENILVLSGAIRDERGSYAPGQICRSAAGSVHSEEVVEDCLCYVVYYGDLEPV